MSCKHLSGQKAILGMLFSLLASGCGQALYVVPEKADVAHVRFRMSYPGVNDRRTSREVLLMNPTNCTVLGRAHVRDFYINPYRDEKVQKEEFRQKALSLGMPFPPEIERDMVVTESNVESGKPILVSMEYRRPIRDTSYVQYCETKVVFLPEHRANYEISYMTHGATSDSFWKPGRGGSCSVTITQFVKGSDGNYQRKEVVPLARGCLK